MSTQKTSLTRVVAVAAMAVGLGAGSYGLAAAASGSGSSSSSSNGSAAQAGTNSSNAAASSAQQPWGGRRSDETPLTGDALSKVTEVALAEVSGGTIERVETDADGHAAYEAHMVKPDGTAVTVYLDEQFNLVSVESR